MMRYDSDPNHMASNTQILRSSPYFPVADVERTATFYERVLGFSREYSAGSPPEFAIVTRDSVSIMLRWVPDGVRVVPNEAQGGTWDVFCWVRDVRALHAELVANGAEVVYGPIVQDAYGMEEFAVRDPNGYVLGFGQPVSG
jgi:catechol 2,3-dioxygenase-like lactoylglutathione lyase family enzyme